MDYNGVYAVPVHAFGQNIAEIVHFRQIHERQIHIIVEMSQHVNVCKTHLNRQTMVKSELRFWNFGIIGF